MACSFMESVQLYTWTARWSSWPPMVMRLSTNAIFSIVSWQGEGVPPELVGVDFIQRRFSEGTVAGPRVGNGHFRE